MTRLQKRLKRFWYNDQQRLTNQFDEFDEILLPQSHSVPLNLRFLVRVSHRLYTHKFSLFLSSCICLPIAFYVVLLSLSNTRAFIPIEFEKHYRRVLLVVAHPDDECLFFSPTLRVLQTQYGTNLSLLVFSRGNHLGLGEIRAMELRGSCRALSIPEERCISLDLPDIRDNPNVWWPEQKLISIINTYVTKWNIDVLISFDSKGASSHLNHRSISFAIHLWIKNITNTQVKKTYELISVSLLRKYASLLDLYVVFISWIPRLLHSLFSYIIPFDFVRSPDSSHILLISTPNDYRASRMAFASHRTQYSWDRHIYLLVSRYMFINELRCIEKNS